MEKYKKTIYGLMLVTMCALAQAADDAQGSKDHPAVGRYPGAVIGRQVISDFDTYSLRISAPGEDQASYNQVKTLALEGKLVLTNYDLPTNASTLAIYRSYQQSLAKGGFKILFKCEKEQCGPTSYWEKQFIGVPGSSEDRQFYLVAKNTSGKNPLYVALHISQNGVGGFISAMMAVLEEIPTPISPIKVSATGMDVTLKASGTDRDGSHDHPAVQRYPAAVINDQSVSDFESYSLVVSAPGNDEASFSQAKTMPLEGRLTRIEYSLPKNAGILGVYRNYQQALTKGGFKILLDCQQLKCGSYSYWSKNIFGSNGAGDENQFHLAAKNSTGKNNIYIAIHISQNGPGGFKNMNLDVLEEKVMQTNLVTTSATGLEESIRRTGKALVYDIYFDTGKADVRPDSEPALKSIAQYLKSSPKIKLYVVGHTDAVGTLNSNMELAQHRAAAVVEVLTTRFGIAKDRLNSQGVGPLAPVETNMNDSGRQKNRRVELVQIL